MSVDRQQRSGLFPKSNRKLVIKEVTQLDLQCREMTFNPQDSETALSESSVFWPSLPLPHIPSYFCPVKSKPFKYSINNLEFLDKNACKNTRGCYPTQPDFSFKHFWGEKHFLVLGNPSVNLAFEQSQGAGVQSAGSAGVRKPTQQGWVLSGKGGMGYTSGF